MRYRINELENVQLGEFKQAKARLEEIAEQENIHLSYAKDDLQTMGFQKEEQLTHKYLGPIQSYSRKTENGIELLVDRDLTRPDDKTPHLYRIPEGMDAQEWSDSIPGCVKGRDEKAYLIAGLGGVIGGSAFAINSITMLTNESWLSGMVIIFSYISIAPIFLGFNKFLTRSNALHSQILAKGPDALRYITKNTSFDNYIKYRQLRFEESSADLPMDNEQQQQQAELEAIAEEEMRIIK